MAYHRQQGVDTAIARIFNTYGRAHAPARRPRDPDVPAPGARNRPLTVYGDGSQTRSFCYVADQIRGLMALAESGYHDPVNIGNPDEFTLLELAEAVKEVTGSSSEIVFEALPIDDPKQRRPDIALAQRAARLGRRRSRCAKARTHDRAGRRRGAGRVRTAWLGHPSAEDSRASASVATFAAPARYTSDMARAEEALAPGGPAVVKDAEPPLGDEQGTARAFPVRGLACARAAPGAPRSRHATQAPARALVPAAHGHGAPRRRGRLAARARLPRCLARDLHRARAEGGGARVVRRRRAGETRATKSTRPVATSPSPTC